MRISQALKIMIVKSEMDYHEIAEKTGVSVRTIKRYEKGEGIENMEKLLLFFTENINNFDFVHALETVQRTKKEIMKDYLDYQKKEGLLTNNQHQFVSKMKDGSRYSFEKDEVYMVKNVTRVYYKKHEGHQQYKEFQGQKSLKEVNNWLIENEGSYELLGVDVVDENSKTVRL